MQTDYTAVPIMSLLPSSAPLHAPAMPAGGRPSIWAMGISRLSRAFAELIPAYAGPGGVPHR